MASLGTILIDGDATSPRNWNASFQAYTMVNEAVGSGGDEETEYVRATFDTNDNDTSFTLAAMPADFGRMLTATFNIKYRVNGRDITNSDTFGLSVRIMNSSTVLAAADSGGSFSVVSSSIAMTGANPAFITTGSPFTFAYVNQDATKATWDGAQVEFRQTWSLVGVADSGRVEVASFDLSGVYQQRQHYVVT